MLGSTPPEGIFADDGWQKNTLTSPLPDGRTVKQSLTAWLDATAPPGTMREAGRARSSFTEGRYGTST